MRDQLKDNNYFDSFISKQYQRLSMFESRLLDNKALNEKVIKNIRYATFNISFQIIVSRYSRGDSLTAIKEDYIKSIPKFKVVFSEIIDMNT
ncbi:PoNe immunity protein domain-containing protein [Streptococcus pneumoniae]